MRCQLTKGGPGGAAGDPLTPNSNPSFRASVHPSALQTGDSAH